jgi:hypothetical protein
MQIAFFESIMGLQSLQCSIKAFKNVAVKHKYFGINDCNPPSSVYRSRNLFEMKLYEEPKFVDV